MSKQYPDRLAVVTRALEGRRAGQGTGDITSILVQITRHPTPQRVGTALGFQLSALTVGSAAMVQAHAILGDAGARDCKLAPVLHQPLAARASVVVTKSAREKVPSVRLALPITGMCSAICFSLTNQARFSVEL
jgi:hypothetical protein